MPRTTFSDSLNQAELLLGGIRANSAALADKGLDEAFARELIQLQNQVRSLDTEQEQIRALLRAKTEQLDALYASMAQKLSEAKKRVKLEVPSTQWKDFGISLVR